jgi:hypothetical protein
VETPDQQPDQATPPASLPSDADARKGDDQHEGETDVDEQSSDS